MHSVFSVGRPASMSTHMGQQDVRGGVFGPPWSVANAGIYQAQEQEVCRRNPDGTWTCPPPITAGPAPAPYVPQTEVVPTYQPSLEPTTFPWQAPCPTGMYRDQNPPYGCLVSRAAAPAAAPAIPVAPLAIGAGALVLLLLLS